MYVFITGTSGHFLADTSAVDKSLGVNLPVMPITAGGCYERHQTGWTGWSTNSEEAIFSLICIARAFITTKPLLVLGPITNNCTLPLEIFHEHNPSARTMALGSTQPLTEMTTRNISWKVKAAGA